MTLLESYDNSELKMLDHCRFCAEKCEDLFHIENYSEKFNNCIEIITFLQINYIDLSESKLPKFTCRECFNSLNSAYNFFIKVKQSQIILNSIYNETSVKQEIEDSICDESSEYLQDSENENDNTIEANENTNDAIDSTSVPVKYDKLDEIKTDTSSESGSSSILMDNDDIKIDITIEANDNSNEAIDSTSVPDKYDKLDETKIDTSSENYNIKLLFEKIKDEDTVTQIKTIKEEKPLANQISKSSSTYNDIPISEKSFVKDVNLSDSWINYKWQCCHCMNTFDNMGELRLHSKESHDICFGFHCIDCIDEFNTFNAFVEHVRQHREGLRYCCQYCNQRFISEGECLDHTTGHWEVTKMICDLCGEILPDQISFDRHKSLYKKKKLHPRMYRKATTQVEPLDRPRWKTWDSYDWTCLECNLKVPNIGMMREHVQQSHKKCFAMKCVDCLKVMANFRLFTAHVAKHRPYLQKICQYCNILIEDETLDVHIKKHFSGLQKPCEGCGQIFENNQVLKQHLNQYDPPRRLGTLTKEDLTCEECNKSFSTMGTLRKHRKTHDPNFVRHYTCDVCGKAFYTVATLRNHKIWHEKKTLTCDICNMKFNSKRSLGYHIMTHSDARPFQCDQCSKTFKTKIRLVRHGVVHRDIKKYVCMVCDKKFKYRGILKNHMNQHTGLRPYACQMCEKTFANHSNRLKHMHRIHGAKDKEKK